MVGSSVQMDTGNDLGPMDDGLQDLGLPVPVQTFLWGQIAPFIRPKLGKLHEATCMVSFSFFSFFLQLKNKIQHTT